MSIFIDSKFMSKRINISIDDYLWDIYSYSCSDPRSHIRIMIKQGKILSSSDARNYILSKVVKPSLLDKLNSKQMDIEDV